MSSDNCRKDEDFVKARVQMNQAQIDVMLMLLKVHGSKGINIPDSCAQSRFSHALGVFIHFCVAAKKRVNQQFCNVVIIPSWFPVKAHADDVSDEISDNNSAVSRVLG